MLTGIIAVIAFVVLGSTQIDTSGRGWKALYHQGVIDKREYYENRFKDFVITKIEHVSYNIEAIYG